MARRESEAVLSFLDYLQRNVSRDSAATAMLLLAETYEATTKQGSRADDFITAYSNMNESASEMGCPGIFADRKVFEDAYKTFLAIENKKINWEQVYVYGYTDAKYGRLSDALFEEYSNRFDLKADTVLIAEGEKFMPNLKRLVDEHSGCKYTITSQMGYTFSFLKRIFESYDNVEVVQANIYSEQFINEKFDLIYSVPAFGGRNLAEDGNFICREFEAVALENLMLHTLRDGQLVITVPARITFAQGTTGTLRNFIELTYTLSEIDELPEGAFEGTGIKTYLLTLTNARQAADDEIVVRRYSSEERKNRRTVAKKLIMAEEAIVFPDELEDQGDWNINKIFSKQDEEWQQFQNSTITRMHLGDIADVFRGKAITTKDPNGGIGVVNISNIGEFDVDYEGLEYLDADERKLSNYMLREGDLLIPARGTTLRTAIFHEQKYPCIACSNVIVIRPDEKQADGTYLKIFFDSPLGQKLVSGVQQGSNVINISYKDLRSLEVPVLPLSEQQERAKLYRQELKIYQDAINVARSRWQETLVSLREF